MVAAMSAIIETNPSTSIAPKPIKGMSCSLMSILGVVPDEIRPWNPEIAPQAIVINMKGNSFPGIIGPPPWANFVMGGMCRVGAIITTPKARRNIVPIFM